MDLSDNSTGGGASPSPLAVRSLLGRSPSPVRVRARELTPSYDAVCDFLAIGIRFMCCILQLAWRSAFGLHLDLGFGIRMYD